MKIKKSKKLSKIISKIILKKQSREEYKCVKQLF